MSLFLAVIIACRKSHWAENSRFIDTIISDYNFIGKVTYIVTVNASNMKAVFKVLFPQSESSTSTQLPESDGEDDNEDESCDSENSAPDWLDNGDSSINEIKAS